MVDVSGKAVTHRTARARAVVKVGKEILALIKNNELITKNGILNHENLDFSDLIKDKVSEFVYVFAPLRMKGATGSAGRPIAIV